MGLILTSSEAEVANQNQASRPFLYILIPLVVIFALASFAFAFHLMRRRILGRNEPERSWPGSRIAGAARRRGAAAREEEGLNELGEAPPPYKTKTRESTASGGPRPPEYAVAEPAPAAAK